MGASGRHELSSVHSHAALLGWVSMGLTALLASVLMFCWIVATTRKGA